MQKEFRQYIPEQLKNLKQWIILNEESKPLYNQTSTDPQVDFSKLDLLSFEEACKIADARFLKKLGFVITRDDPYVALTMKNSINAQDELNIVAKDVVEQIQSYREIHDDDTHIICEGILPFGNQEGSLGGIQLFDTGIITLTGHAMFENQQIIESTREIVQIYNKYFNKAEKQLDSNPNELATSASAILEDLNKMEQDTKLINLLKGNWKSDYDSHIDADLALCTALAIATNNNKDLVDKAFRNSKLYRQCWDKEYYHNGRTYGEEILSTVLNAYKDKGIGKNQRFLEPTDSLPPWYSKNHKGVLTFTPTVLAEYLSDTAFILFSNDKYYQYKRGVYKEVSINDVNSTMLQNLLKYHVIPKHMTNTETFLRTLNNRSDKTLNGDASIYQINFKNGILDVNTKFFSSHTPQHLSSIQMDCNYDPSSQSPQFQNYLSQILDENEMLIMQELLGYLLIPNTNAQKAFILFGPGRTGKSTFLQIIEMIIGNTNISNVSWHNLESVFEPATLFGKLVNLFGDLPASSLRDTANFKALTGGDTINAQFKNKQIFSFKNKARLVFSCNQLPINNVDRTDAFYRRIVLIPFTKQIPAGQIDPNLITKLQKEKEGIVQWALQGLYRLINNNFKFTKSDKADQILEQYKTNNDSVLWFMKNFCELNLDSRCYSQELYEAYKASCKINGLQSKTQPQFNNDILSYSNGAILKDKEGKTKRAIYRGICLQ